MYHSVQRWKGGEAKPIKGASGNGMSNYFPAVSPDGKWLFIVRQKSFMLLLQPDSRLHIIPLEVGNRGCLKANFKSMNSWHAWSPNSKWIVFVPTIRSLY
ncbi:MAG: PD40 domain-containing protein [Bacteroidetes bacterium]|nr:PD40 domain-containing protein [Bacteroidota bacterium]